MKRFMFKVVIESTTGHAAGVTYICAMNAAEAVSIAKLSYIHPEKYKFTATKVRRTS